MSEHRNLILVCNEASFYKGQKVIARNSKDGLYYSGYVRRCVDAENSLVCFLFGKKSVIKNTFIIAVTNDGSHQRLKIGDYVLAKFERNDNEDCYVPGIINVTPKKSVVNRKEFEVQNFDDTQMLLQRQMLFKIDPDRCPYIVRITRNSTERPNTGYDSDNILGIPHNRENAIVLQRVKQTIKPKQKRPKSPDEVKKGFEDIKETLEEINDKMNKIQLESIDQKQLLVSHEIELQSAIYLMETQKKSVPEVSSKRDFGTNTQPIKKKKQKPKPVVARSLQDGWYYRGTVVGTATDGKLDFHDYSGFRTSTLIADIIYEKEDSKIKIEVNEKVIGLHPTFPNSYVPATVVKEHPGLTYDVRIYDDTTATLTRDQMYWLKPERYELCVDHINKCLERWVGETVIARSDNDGLYYVCKCCEWKSPGQLFSLQWPDGSTSVQIISCIFGPFTQKRTINKGDFVLAHAEDQLFLPGRVISKLGTTFIVAFSNGTRQHQVKQSLCFWISKEYHDYAMSYQLSKH